MGVFQLISCLPLMALLCGAGSYAAQPTSLPVAPFYSSAFVTPQPPRINTEFRANYMQHKYNVNISTNIVSGFLYMSPTLQKIRLDGATDGTLEASLFDFTNTTSDGLVSNQILNYTGGLASPECDTFFVSPFLPLVPSDILTTSGAAYTGVQHDDLYGAVSVWMFKFTDVVVQVFLDANNTLVRYDFAGPGPLRTFATTRFFNIIPGPIDPAVFEVKCP